MTAPSSERTEMPSAYDPHAVEQRLYDFWESQGYFQATIEPGKPAFTIIMPPPNDTGELHLGHALTAAIEDATARRHQQTLADAVLVRQQPVAVALRHLQEPQPCRQRAEHTHLDAAHEQRAAGEGAGAISVLAHGGMSRNLSAAGREARPPEGRWRW